MGSLEDDHRTTDSQHRRVALLLEYDGGPFQGLQRQAHTRETIQQYVEAAARQAGAPEDTGFVASGRTDAGVHAVGQVVALSLPRRLEEHRVARALNALLPPAIRVRRAADCGGFHPRFDATSRTYKYRFWPGGAVPPLLQRYVAELRGSPDPQATCAAADAFVGRWELHQWRSSHCQAARTLLTIDECRADPPPPPDGTGLGGYWTITVRARSFLHHQVRLMAGAVTAVGLGKLSLEELRQALHAGHRPVLVKNEDPRGLVFTKVDFKEGKDPWGGGAAS